MCPCHFCKKGIKHLQDGYRAVRLVYLRNRRLCHSFMVEIALTTPNMGSTSNYYSLMLLRNKPFRSEQSLRRERWGVLQRRKISRCSYWPRISASTPALSCPHRTDRQKKIIINPFLLLLMTTGTTVPPTSPPTRTSPTLNSCSSSASRTATIRPAIASSASSENTSRVKLIAHLSTIFSRNPGQAYPRFD